MKIVRPFESRKNVSSCPFSGTQPPSGVRGVAGRAEEAESLILARYPAYAWCAETGGDGVRARAVERARDEGLRGGNVLRLRILNGPSDENPSARRGVEYARILFLFVVWW
jgi:hypothetical protein